MTVVFQINHTLSESQLVGSMHRPLNSISFYVFSPRTAIIDTG